MSIIVPGPFTTSSPSTCKAHASDKKKKKKKFSACRTSGCCTKYTRREPNQLTPPSQDDRLLQQLRLQDDDLSNSFVPPAPSTMPSTSSSISDGFTHLTPTPSMPHDAGIDNQQQ